MAAPPATPPKQKKATAAVTAAAPIPAPTTPPTTAPMIAGCGELLGVADGTTLVQQRPLTPVYADAKEQHEPPIQSDESQSVFFVHLVPTGALLEVPDARLRRDAPIESHESIGLRDDAQQ